MSGTSLDGVDAVVARIGDSGPPSLLGHIYLPFPASLRTQLLALNTPGENEIHRAAVAGNHVAQCYAECVEALLNTTGLKPDQITAIGSHGQTIRHRPDAGYTVQVGNAALLAELSNIPVVADFRSRDIAAGGQGAPLVPAFHRAVFGSPDVHRCIVNIGGISNITDLPPRGKTRGFDCGPGNLLMDAWIQHHRGVHYDTDGSWAAQGVVIPVLLERLLQHPFFQSPPPKSTGRDDFHLTWLTQHLKPEYRAVDIQATLLELTARCIADALMRHCRGFREIYLCGGGAHNQALRHRLKALCPDSLVTLTDTLGLGTDWVEATAFAWLAKQAISGQPTGLPEVTGAHGARILGALYPA